VDQLFKAGICMVLLKGLRGDSYQYTLSKAQLELLSVDNQY